MKKNKLLILFVSKGDKTKRIKVERGENWGRR